MHAHPTPPPRPPNTPQICLRVIQGLYCVAGSDGLQRLSVELETVCYADDHVVAAIVMWSLAVVYMAGFPAMMFFFAHKAVKSETRVVEQLSMDTSEDSSDADLDAKALEAEKERVITEVREVREEKYGFIFRGVDPRVYWFRVMGVVLQCVTAFEFVIPQRLAGKLIASALNIVINLMVVSYYWPFTNVWNNVLHLGSGLATMAQVFVFLVRLLGWGGVGVGL